MNGVGCPFARELELPEAFPASTEPPSPARGPCLANGNARKYQKSSPLPYFLVFPRLSSLFSYTTDIQVLVLAAFSLPLLFLSLPLPFLFFFYCLINRFLLREENKGLLKNRRTLKNWKGKVLFVTEKKIC